MSKNWPKLDNFELSYDGLIASGILGGAALSYFAYEYIKPEPEQFYFLLIDSAKIYKHLIANGFKDLPPFGELIRIGKLWSVYAKIPPHFELHVRAIKKSKDAFFISAHIDYPRENPIEHLKGLKMDQTESYRQGMEILKLYLPLNNSTSSNQ
jgi:hypothetical protein